ncbi:MAG: FkbM family methyltransferase, partial [Candidatus Zipacnadales bacterium]
GHTFAMKKCALSLDDFCEQQGLHPELVKIDVEGGEERVLRGMWNIMERMQPPVVVEVHRWPDQDLATRAMAVYQVARDVGYDVFYYQANTFLDEQEIRNLTGFRCWLLLLMDRERVPVLK